jgi:hypothetical protein
MRSVLNAFPCGLYALGFRRDGAGGHNRSNRKLRGSTRSFECGGLGAIAGLGRPSAITRSKRRLVPVQRPPILLRLARHRGKHGVPNCRVYFGGGKRRGWAPRSITSEPGAK